MIRGAVRQFVISVRLYFRNPLAMSYGYLFPTLFLAAYWGLYRFDRVPLVRHMGELLTVTVLGGACFGLPTTLVSEREKGVWRRYRLLPVPVGSLVASTMAARYILVITAGLLQIGLAMLIGMPPPLHPFDLWVAFTVVAFAFLGCGLMIAMMADTVPAVQALGQTIFLPMLIIGGIAVPLASLPQWAQHASAFFPGRYAVEALQAGMTGDGVGSTLFSIVALVVIGFAACMAGAMMFRWDEHERFAMRGDRAWLVLALAAWAAVGTAAEFRGRIATTGTASTAALAPASQPVDIPITSASPLQSLRATTAEVAAGAAPPSTPPRSTGAPENANAGPVSSRPHPTSWQAVSQADIDADLTFDNLPPDGGIITPIETAADQPDPSTAESVATLAHALPQWGPGSVSDPVQRVRNLLYVAAVPDLLQMDIERYVPAIVYERIQAQTERSELIKVLYWIALHPFDDDDQAVGDVAALGLPSASALNPEDVRARAAVYGVKLLGRLIGKIHP
ncbi:MAG TPA: ABC transporter permease [Vicinamibacterales bacterium]|nr:ABC transporter permease [Vicinamibacterales bacterium]